MKMRMKTTMNQAPSRLRTAATAASGTMNTLLRAGLGAALLALTAACSGDLDAGSDGLEGELEGQGSEVVDVSDSLPEPAGAIEKAAFNDNLTFNNVNIACTATQKALIREADTRAREILGIAGPANASARVNRNTTRAGIFRTYFIPNGNRNPDPNRTSPDAWDTASFRVGQKTAKVSDVLASAVHGCPAGNEPVARREDGTFATCNQSGANAATDFAGDNAIRWCSFGLAQSLDDRAVTLLHELTHQDRTADATGLRVWDDDRNGRLYHAQNWSSWFRNNTTP